MESIYPELALCGSKNECGRTETVFLNLSEVSEGTVSLSEDEAFLIKILVPRCAGTFCLSSLLILFLPEHDSF